jgi:cellulose synthase (UDP-forming)
MSYSSLYKGTSAITGALHDGIKVTYRDTLTTKEKRVLNLLGLLTIATNLWFILWLITGTQLPTSGGVFATITVIVMVALMSGLELIRLAQSLTLGYFATKAKDPIPLKPRTGLRIAVLTTIVPGKEPLELVLTTLRAMRQIEHPGNYMDVWLLDEGNDPIVKAACEDIGVNHFSRKGIDAFNRRTGFFKAKTKHGNHNSWRARNEGDYDIVAQMDPDHIPSPDFLTRTIGYFNDSDVSFVVAPQVYGNLGESFIARGSAFLAYIFHGVIQRGGNGMSAPLLIGTNHLYRVEAFKQIGGYQDSIIEDHLTSMIIYTKDNPQTGNRWKGVYTPDILAIGEGPTSFTDFFNQQKRWAYGIWEIMTGHSPSVFPNMKPAQRLSFAMLQFFYPSVAVSWVLSSLLTAMYVISNVSLGLQIEQWAMYWGLSTGSGLLLFYWLRRFNIAEHERKDWGFAGMILMMMCIPVYVSAAVAHISGKQLAYAVTAKGNLTSPDNIKTFAPHLVWASVAGLMIGISFTIARSPYLAYTLWLTSTIVICLSPIAVHYAWRLREMITLRKAAVLDSPSSASIASITVQNEAIPATVGSAA